MRTADFITLKQLEEHPFFRSAPPEQQQKARARWIQAANVRGRELHGDAWQPSALLDAVSAREPRPVLAVPDFAKSATAIAPGAVAAANAIGTPDYTSTGKAAGIDLTTAARALPAALARVNEAFAPNARAAVAEPIPSGAPYRGPAPARPADPFAVSNETGLPPHYDPRGYLPNVDALPEPKRAAREGKARGVALARTLGPGLRAGAEMGKIAAAGLRAMVTGDERLAQLALDARHATTEPRANMPGPHPDVYTAAASVEQMLESYMLSAPTAGLATLAGGPKAGRFAATGGMMAHYAFTGMGDTYLDIIQAVPDIDRALARRVAVPAGVLYGATEGIADALPLPSPTEKLIAKLAIKDALVRTAARFAGQFAGEVAEEGVQAFISAAAVEAAKALHAKQLPGLEESAAKTAQMLADAWAEAGASAKSVALMVGFFGAAGSVGRKVGLLPREASPGQRFESSDLAGHRAAVADPASIGIRSDEDVDAYVKAHGLSAEFAGVLRRAVADQGATDTATPTEETEDAGAVRTDTRQPTRPGADEQEREEARGDDLQRDATRERAEARSAPPAAETPAPITPKPAPTPAARQANNARQRIRRLTRSLRRAKGETQGSWPQKRADWYNKLDAEIADLRAAGALDEKTAAHIRRMDVYDRAALARVLPEALSDAERTAAEQARNERRAAAEAKLPGSFVRWMKRMNEPPPPGITLGGEEPEAAAEMRARVDEENARLARDRDRKESAARRRRREAVADERLEGFRAEVRKHGIRYEHSDEFRHSVLFVHKRARASGAPTVDDWFERAKAMGLADDSEDMYDAVDRLLRGSNRVTAQSAKPDPATPVLARDVQEGEAFTDRHGDTAVVVEKHKDGSVTTADGRVRRYPAAEPVALAGEFKAPTPDQAARAREKVASGEPVYEPDEGAEYGEIDEDERFSVTGSAGALSPADERKRGVLERLTRIARGALPVRVVARRAEFPERIRARAAEEAKRRGIEGEPRIRGVYDPETGAVWFALDELRSVPDAVGAWMHEQGLHNGLRGVMDEAELNKFLDGVAERFDLDGRLAAEEGLAEIAEKLNVGRALSARERNIWQLFADFVRKMLIRAGVRVRLSNRQIADALADAMRYTFTGEGAAARPRADVDAAAAAGVRFSVRPAPAGEPPQACPPEAELLDEARYWDALARNYAAGESSRTLPVRALPALEVGMWRVSDIRANDGRTIDQLRWLDPRALSLSERMVERNEEGRGSDAERYAEWLDQGQQPPPIEVVETDEGRLRVTNGHRRTAAAVRAGRPVLAWVSPAMDVLSGWRYNGDPQKPVIKTALTYEAWRDGRAERTAPLAGAASDYGVDPGMRFSVQGELGGGLLGGVGAKRVEQFAAGMLDMPSLPDWVRAKARNVREAARAGTLADPAKAYDELQKTLDAAGQQAQRVRARSVDAQPDLFGARGPGQGTLFSLGEYDEAESRAWKDQVRRAAKDPASIRTLRVGKTPALLRAVGAQALPMTMPSSVLRKATSGERHNVPMEVIEDLHAHMADPMLVADSVTQPNALVVVFDVQVRGAPILAAIHLERREKRNVVNRIASVYEKDTPTMILAAVRKGSARYINRKKFRAWVQSGGLQLPAEGPRRDGIKILHEDNAVKGTRFALAGEGARTVGKTDVPARLEREGADAARIWRETGWWRGLDGKWRFEVDDSQMRLTGARSGDLDMVIEYDALFDAYPQLRDVFVVVDRAPRVFGQEKPTGSYRQGAEATKTTFGRQPEIRVEAETDEAVRDALVHEIQHAIQEIEGFTRGGNLDTLRRTVIPDARYVGAARQVRELAERNGLSVDDVLAKPPRYLAEVAGEDVVQRLARDDAAFREAWNKSLSAQDVSGADFYKRLGGEVEARVVQRRLDYPAALRAAEPPFETMARMLHEEGLLRGDETRAEDAVITRFSLAGEREHLGLMIERYGTEHELTITDAQANAPRNAEEAQNRLRARPPKLRNGFFGNAPVGLSGNYLRHMVRSNAGRVKNAAMGSLDELFAAGVGFERSTRKEDESWNVRRIVKLFAPFRMDGKLYAVEFTVKDLKNPPHGNNLYHAEVEEIKVGAIRDGKAGTANATFESALTITLGEFLGDASAGTQFSLGEKVWERLRGGEAAYDEVGRAADEDLPSLPYTRFHDRVLAQFAGEIDREARAKIVPEEALESVKPGEFLDIDHAMHEMELKTGQPFYRVTKDALKQWRSNLDDARKMVEGLFEGLDLQISDVHGNQEREKRIFDYLNTGKPPEGLTADEKTIGDRMAAGFRQFETLVKRLRHRRWLSTGELPPGEPDRMRALMIHGKELLDEGKTEEYEQWLDEADFGVRYNYVPGHRRSSEKYLRENFLRYFGRGFTRARDGALEYNEKHPLIGDFYRYMLNALNIERLEPYLHMYETLWQKSGADVGVAGRFLDNLFGTRPPLDRWQRFLMWGHGQFFRVRIPQKIVQWAGRNLLQPSVFTLPRIASPFDPVFWRKAHLLVTGAAKLRNSPKVQKFLADTETREFFKRYVTGLDAARKAYLYQEVQDLYDLRMAMNALDKIARLYSWADEVNRGVTFMYGFEATEAALARFRKKPTRANLNKLLSVTGMQFAPILEQREFIELIDAGQDREAAYVAGKRLADATQFRYIRAERGLAWQKPGSATDITAPIATFWRGTIAYTRDYVKDVAPALRSLKDGKATAAQRRRAVQGAARFLAWLVAGDYVSQLIMKMWDRDRKDYGWRTLLYTPLGPVLDGIGQLSEVLVDVADMRKGTLSSFAYALHRIGDAFVPLYMLANKGTALVRAKKNPYTGKWLVQQNFRIPSALLNAGKRAYAKQRGKRPPRDPRRWIEMDAVDMVQRLLVSGASPTRKRKILEVWDEGMAERDPAKREKLREELDALLRHYPVSTKRAPIPRETRYARELVPGIETNEY